MRELTQFLELLYNDTDGYIYTATKTLSGDFDKSYFKWPAQRQGLLDHISQKFAGAETYICPAVFREPSAQKIDVLGSNVVWAEFDTQLPKNWNGTPEPNVIVESSPGHFHTYWLLEEFTSSETVEKINRKIAYSYGADLSGWDANQLLRPPNTINHKRGGKVVRLAKVEDTPKRSSISFGTLVEAPERATRESFGEIPQAVDVIARYPWPQKLWELFQKGNPSDRSDGMMALGYGCAELGMTNAEIYSILINADSRVGKFSKRPNQQQYIEEIVTKARIKHPLTLHDEDDFTGYSPTSLLLMDRKLKWIMHPFLHSTGLFTLTGAPGIGKSSMCLSLQQSLCLGNAWLDTPVETKLRVGFLSLEMPPEELQPFLQNQLSVYDSDQMSRLNEAMVIFPLGTPINLNNPATQEKITKLVEAYDLSGLIIDSLSSCTPDELSSDKQAKVIYDFDAWLRKRYGIFTVHIHHNRKAQSDNKRPNKLSDVFGSSIMIIRPSTIVTLWQETNSRIEFKPLKTRLGTTPVPFHISRTDALHFSRKVQGVGFTLTSKATGEEVKVHPVDEALNEEGKEVFIGGTDSKAFGM